MGGRGAIKARFEWRWFKKLLARRHMLPNPTYADISTSWLGQAKCRRKQPAALKRANCDGVYIHGVVDNSNVKEIRKTSNCKRKYLARIGQYIVKASIDSSSNIGGYSLSTCKQTCGRYSLQRRQKQRIAGSVANGLLRAYSTVTCDTFASSNAKVLVHWGINIRPADVVR